MLSKKSQSSKAAKVYQNIYNSLSTKNLKEHPVIVFSLVPRRARKLS